ncbi:unnamed protein product, partial [Amoebophrya sp. A120]
KELLLNSNGLENYFSKLLKVVGFSVLANNVEHLVIPGTFPICRKNKAKKQKKGRGGGVEKQKTNSATSSLANQTGILFE